MYFVTEWCPLLRPHWRRLSFAILSSPVWTLFSLFALHIFSIFPSITWTIYSSSLCHGYFRLSVASSRRLCILTQIVSEKCSPERISSQVCRSSMKSQAGVGISPEELSKILRKIWLDIVFFLGQIMTFQNFRPLFLRFGNCTKPLSPECFIFILLTRPQLS